jgi:hypothetical protein
MDHSVGAAGLELKQLSCNIEIPKDNDNVQKVCVRPTIQETLL